MKILLDGRVLGHEKTTGVENHAINIAKKLEEKIQLDIAVPKYKNKYYAHFWEHCILPLKALKYDILFCPSNIAPLYLPKSVKLVLTLHDLSYKDFADMYSAVFRKYYEFVVPKALQRADKVLTISKYSYNRIIGEYDFVKNKIEFIYHGLGEIFVYDKNTQRGNYLLYVGSMNDTKNFSSVIKAFKRCENLGYDLMMVMPTSANFHLDVSKQHLLEEAQANPHIKIVDYVVQEELVKIYQKAKLFVFPSYHESFGFPILEAMACGTPVICSDVTSMPEIGGDAVVYCDPYDIEDIENKILSVLSDKELQEQMKIKGLQRASMFSWEKAAEAHIEIFNKVLGR